MTDPTGGTAQPLDGAGTVRPLQLRFASRSEVGLVRKTNQDSGLAGPRLLAVADGMGGAAAGDVASAVAVDSLRRADDPGTGEQMLGVFAAAIAEANGRIADLVAADSTLEGMGTTLTGVMFDGSSFGLAHIGDSRAYLLRDGRLTRLTHDDTWVQTLVDEGKITEAEAALHPHRSLLVKVLNGQPTAAPDLRMVPVQPGDRLLLCSDGLCGLLDDDELAATLHTEDLTEAVHRLVDAAYAAGGVDNVTVLLADVVTGEGTSDVSVLGAAADHPVPPLPTAVAGATGAAPAAAPADEERYRPQPPRRRRLLRPLFGLLALLLVVGTGLGTAYAWTQTQYFVGAQADRVAIFRGVADGLPGLALSRVYEVQPLAVGDLPPYYQQRVRETVAVSSLEAARSTVAELSAAARRCAEAPRPARPPASPSPAPTETGPPTPGPAPAAPTPVRSTPAVVTPPASAVPAPEPSVASSAASPAGPGC